MSSHAPRRTRRTSLHSRRAVAASAIFGITTLSRTGQSGAEPEYRNAAAQLDRELRPGQIALITGPSGSGKSSILRTLAMPDLHGAKRMGRRTFMLNSISSDSLVKLTGLDDAPVRSIVDLIDADIEHTLSALAAVGLAEASLFARPFDALSDGQKHRLFLALAIAPRFRTRGKHGPPRTILIDEFCSILDRLTARAISESIGKWFRLPRNHNIRTGTPPRLILATAHDDLSRHLRPDAVLRVPLAPDTANPIRLIMARHTPPTK